MSKKIIAIILDNYNRFEKADGVTLSFYTKDLLGNKSSMSEEYEGIVVKTNKFKTKFGIEVEYELPNEETIFDTNHHKLIFVDVIFSRRIEGDIAFQKDYDGRSRQDE